MKNTSYVIDCNKHEDINIYRTMTQDPTRKKFCERKHFTIEEKWAHKWCHD